jgi:beta-xylosidase
MLSLLLGGVPAPSVHADNLDTPNGWSVGLATGSDPFHLRERASPPNPILTNRHISNPPTAFVADPFLVREGNSWNIFFELFNTESNRGEIGVAESFDASTWSFQKVIIAEPFHLSYPFVLKDQGDYYMIPESRQAKAIRLYKAKSYPLEWEFERTLIEGEFVDPSPVFYLGRWWLFAGHDGYSLSLFFADSLRGPWTKHPQSPIYRDNPRMARPGGKPTVVDGKLIRFVQDNEGGYGKSVRVMIVDEITPTSFQEHTAPVSPIFKAHGEHWARNGMHHVAPVQLGANEWLAAIDGSGDGKPEK